MITILTKVLNCIAGILHSTNTGTNIKWSSNGITVAGGNGVGEHLDEFCNSYGIYVDNDQTIYIADSGNHRVIE